jgi:hypothetical protein
VILHKHVLVEPAMTIIHHEIHGKCPPEHVWTLLADLEAVERYNPSVRSAKIRGDRRSGVGAERACELSPSGRVVERVTVWDPGRAVGLEVVESDWPIHFMRWVTKVEPSRDGCVIRQDLEYEVKFGVLGRLMDRWVMKRRLTRTLDELFRSLLAYAGRA